MIKLDILAIGAHPDDVELGCGATLAKEISRGKKVGILDLTRGELGTRGSAENGKLAPGRYPHPDSSRTRRHPHREPVSPPFHR